MNGELIFLGTGTSMGVPTLGCECAVCSSEDPRDKRLRPSILLRWKDPAARGGVRNILIDTGPDFRTQALAVGLKHLDAVLYTHSHADHILGFDDLRPISFEWYRGAEAIPLYTTRETRETLEQVFAYTLSPRATYSNRARVRLEPLGEHNEICGVDFQPVPVLHGDLPIIGYRFGKTAYLTDVSTIPESSFALLKDLDVLILSALRHKPHPNHLTLNQAREWAARIGARQTWFTHIAHELGHEATNKGLPAGVALAHDGLRIPIELGIA
jgi:phosphoribosyl 1,2-cyclic phosphate phosphodiesterase